MNSTTASPRYSSLSLWLMSDMVSSLWPSLAMMWIKVLIPAQTNTQFIQVASIPPQNPRATALYTPALSLAKIWISENCLCCVNLPISMPTHRPSIFICGMFGQFCLKYHKSGKEWQDWPDGRGYGTCNQCLRIMFSCLLLSVHMWNTIVGQCKRFMKISWLLFHRQRKSVVG